jgi:hypothetical protein
MYIFSRYALSTHINPQNLLHLKLHSKSSNHSQENHCIPLTEVKMASEATSSSTTPEDTSFFCCVDIFNEISEYSATLFLTPEGIVMDPIRRSLNPPIPKIDISPTDTDNIFSKSQRIMQVQGPIHANWELGQRPSVIEAQEIKQRIALPSTPTPLITQYFAGIMAEGGSEIETWGKLGISDDRFRSEPGLNKIPPGTASFYKGCSGHKNSFIIDVWTR